MKAQDLFEKVTADLITAIEDGASGWRMPWQCLAGGTPTSVDGRPYRGWNTMVLAMVAADRGWPSNRWATYRAWQRHGCQVRRGERGTRVVLWKPTERPRADESDEKAQSSRSLIARVYTVFAAEQADGSDRFVPQPRRGR